MANVIWEGNSISRLTIGISKELGEERLGKGRLIGSRQKRLF